MHTKYIYFFTIDPQSYRITGLMSCYNNTAANDRIITHSGTQLIHHHGYINME